MTEYRAGGIVTMRLEAWQSDTLNDDLGCILQKSQILSYEPPKEPIVWYSGLDKNGEPFSTKYLLACEKTPEITWYKHKKDPVTGEVKSEVMK